MASMETSRKNPACVDAMFQRVFFDTNRPMNLLINANPNLILRSDCIKRARKKSSIDPFNPKICSTSFSFLLY